MATIQSLLSKLCEPKCIFSIYNSMGFKNIQLFENDWVETKLAKKKRREYKTLEEAKKILALFFKTYLQQLNIF